MQAPLFTCELYAHKHRWGSFYQLHKHTCKQTKEQCLEGAGTSLNERTDKNTCMVYCYGKVAILTNRDRSINCFSIGGTLLR